MSEIERLREAILEQARNEAERIVKDAEERAKQIIEEAKRRKEEEIAEARKRVLEEVGYEARISEAKIRARHIVAKAKNEVLEELRKRVLEELSTLPVTMRRESLRKLLQEVLASGAVQGSVRIYVSKRDVREVENVVRELGVESRVIEIVPTDIVGGVIVESGDGLVRIDNSYEARLDTYLRTRASQIARELFG